MCHTHRGGRSATYSIFPFLKQNNSKQVSRGRPLYQEGGPSAGLEFVLQVPSMEPRRRRSWPGYLAQIASVSLRQTPTRGLRNMPCGSHRPRFLRAWGPQAGNCERTGKTGSWSGAAGREMRAHRSRLGSTRVTLPIPRGCPSGARTGARK